MIDMEEFKDQLLTFMEFMDEPLDADSIYRQCVQPIDRRRIHDALYQLEDEGKILRLSDGRYIAVRKALKRWIRGRLVEIKISEEIISEARQIEHMLKRYKTIDYFISEAIKEYIEKIWKILCGKADFGKERGNM